MTLPRPRRDRTRCARLPIAFIHQDLGLIEWMTVAENICLTLGYPRRFGMIDWDAARSARRRGAGDRSAPTSTRTCASRASAAPRSRWSPSPARWPPRPRSSCSTSRPPACRPTRWRGCSRRCAGCATRGVGMIYVSHRLDEVFEIADRMVVLRDGRVVGERRVGETTPEEAILLIVGREPSQVFRRPAQREGAARLVLERLTVERRSGRSTARSTPARSSGFVGLRGAGQEAVGRALFGLAPDHRRPSRCSTASRSLPPRRAQAMDARHQPRLRRPGRANRSLPNSRVRENLFLNPLAAGRGLFSYLAPAPRDRAPRCELGERVGLAAERLRRCRSSCCRAATSRRSWSAAGCISAASVYVFEDPTAGVDVGAKAEIYRLFDVALQARRRDPHRLDRLRGGRQGLPPRAGLRPRPGRRRARRPTTCRSRTCSPRPRPASASGGTRIVSAGDAHAVH